MGICFGKGDGKRNIYSTNQARVQSIGGAQQGESTNWTGELVVLNDPTKGHGIEQKYELREELGRGQYGVTYLCIDKESGEKFACKVISKRGLSRDEIDDVRREVEIMRHLPEHPNIVSLKQTYEDNDAVHLVMELCEGGELFHSIASRGRYTEKEAAAVTRTIVEVVEVCHKYGVMHLDLKPENFLYANKNERAPLKVIDFGLSVFFKPGEIFSERLGSPYTMAPDVLNRNYGPEVDIWSADTYEMIIQEIHLSVIDFSRDPWPRVSDNAKDLVRGMLNRNPRARLTAQEVLEHPWLQNASTAPNVSLGEEVKARLRQFSAMNKLKKRALRVIADYLPAEEVEESKERFKNMDVSNRGKINSDELRAGLQNLGYHVPDADLQTVMEAADDNKDGYLDYGEFVAARVHLKKLGNDEQLHKAFEFFDLNKNGYIEIEELRHALANGVDANDEEVIKAIMHDVDTDKDGKISYEEFAAMMNAGIDWKKASRRYSQERFNSFNLNFEKGESSQIKKE